jgi:hypothetical protein
MLVLVPADQWIAAKNSRAKRLARPPTPYAGTLQVQKTRLRSNVSKAFFVPEIRSNRESRKRPARWTTAMLVKIAQPGRLRPTDWIQVDCRARQVAVLLLAFANPEGAAWRRQPTPPAPGKCSWLPEYFPRTFDFFSSGAPASTNLRLAKVNLFQPSQR